VLRPHERGRWAEHEGEIVPMVSEIPRCARPPGVVIFAPPEVPRNAERAQCEGPHFKEGYSAATGIIRPEIRKPRPDARRAPSKSTLLP
jgi:hypothetical protein